MSVKRLKEDQAEPLRQHMSRRSTDEANEVESLPSRKNAHRNRKKKGTFKMTFPLVRLLLMIFLLIVMLLVFSPYWLNQ
ncbi:hypothetical protein [Bacillus sp. FJAT-45037]|uniref:hypothetical protein n=1 Tax=Bacillus sp. FJAT-45037 TaxID=2011007 RepID=UPI000C242C0B|nr:hypothetical protein [Bacillus sp. FJAT-45037]